MVNRKIESKYVANYVTPEPVQIWASTIPTGVGAVPQLYDCIPALVEGDGSFQRTGNKVQPTKHTVDVEVSFNNLRNDITNAAPLDSCSWDITAHVWYGYARRYKNVTDVNANSALILQQMLEDGQGNTAQWSGQPDIDQFKLNNEVVQLKHKSFRMYRPFGSQNEATLTGGLTTYFPQSLSKRFTLSFKPPKTLMFSEVTQVPQNYAPFMIVAYKHNDYTQGASIAPDAPDLLNKPALMMTARTHMWYKDA